MEIESVGEDGPKFCLVSGDNVTENKQAAAISKDNIFLKIYFFMRKFSLVII